MATATAKAVIDSVEDTLENLDEQLDIIENGAQVVKGTKLVVGGLVVAALGVGAATTYFIMKKKLEAKFEERLGQEIAEAREFYAKRNKEGEYSSPQELARHLVKDRDSKADIRLVQNIARSYQSDDVAAAHETLENGTRSDVEVADPDASPEVSTAMNVFKQVENFDYETEIQNRTEEAPYIITYDEWSGNESEYDQSTLTYYEGDDILVDSTDQPIQETDDTVGDNNLLRFGHGSKDNNVVYIRNDRVELEWEVVRSPGKYSEEVLGFMEHSARDRRPRKFRSYDE